MHLIGCVVVAMFVVEAVVVVVVVLVKVMFAGLVNGVAVDVVDGWLRT